MKPRSNHFKEEGSNSFVENDEVLWEGFKSGNINFFSIIYQKNIQALYNYGLQVIKDPELIEDNIQDLFIYLWDNKGTLGETNNIKFYLFKSLRRRLFTKLKSRGKEELSDDIMHHEYRVEKSYEHNLILVQTQQSQQELLNRSMLHLTTRQREAIYLRFFDNLSFQEIADVMALGLKSTYNLISKALDVLRQYLYPLLLVILLSHFNK
jgi:RNA polymerase sigma factor (sigma-70 family)